MVYTVYHRRYVIYTISYGFYETAHMMWSISYGPYDRDHNILYEITKILVY